MPTGQLSRTVGQTDTAAAWGPEFPAAASTPFVRPMAELVCLGILAQDLAEVKSPWAQEFELTHDRPSPVDAVLTARATLNDRHGRKVSFAIDVVDESEQVMAHIRHPRAVVKRSILESALIAHEPSPWARQRRPDVQRERYLVEQVDDCSVLPTR